MVSILYILVGMFVGLRIVHPLLRRLGLRMFAGDKGSWFVTFMTTIGVMTVGGHVYNAIISLDSDGAMHTVDGSLGMPWTRYTLMTATGTDGGGRVPSGVCVCVCVCVWGVCVPLSGSVASALSPVLAKHRCQPCLPSLSLHCD